MLVAACAGPPAQPTVASSGADMETAARLIVESLNAQLDRQGEGGGGLLRGLTSKLPDPVSGALGRSPAQRITIAFDPMLDGTSGQRTALSAELERAVLARFATERPDVQFVKASPEQLRQVELMMVGSVTLESSSTPGLAARTAPGMARVAMVSRSKNTVVAQTQVRVRNQGFDLTPQRLEQDSPVVVMDKAVQGMLTSAGTPAGQPVDPSYLRQIGASAAIAQGTDAYNAGRYAEALKHFEVALADPSGEQIRAQNGLYLSYMRLGRGAEAEQMFGRIVATGIRDRNLAIKFLFSPGSTEFWSDNQVSSPYAMWIRQVARNMERSTLCADVLGHASRTGAESVNEKLSEQRADVIRRRLIAESGALVPKLSARGMGSRETIVGLGTDDARDAVDRRVGFTFRECR